MLQTILSVLTNILFFAAIPVFVFGAYQQHKFFEEWREDHAQSLDWFTRGQRSVVAVLSNKLSDRCRDRRRKLFTAVATFLGLILVVGLLSAFQRSQ
ncbi:hypothetical protein G8O24_24240 [Bradyrhizobium sp. INPA01-394B]|uniref:Uncharacterized protein n=1 Tax=Bradyrhizobium campsiandrae TaxID=1729892 RepID=A0ABR7UDC7_9BRAD|nr:hypothetical protein [Bradyrhizobium campsiandrae]MBC9880439.1 hypothetical protein [Bradyrhizobium campsiandrae]MBC9982015.1 hypothetical protein [Bradyrhizobium campsiandrae]